MANICINTLYAEGSKKQIDKLVSKISDEFSSSFQQIDYDGTDPRFECYFESSYEFPKDVLKNITDNMPGNEDLFIRVISEESSENYYEQFIFENGQWNYEIPVDVKAQVEELKQIGLKQIRDYLKVNGTVTQNNKYSKPIIYVDGYAIPNISFYKEFHLETNMIMVCLTNGYILDENELTIDQILDIITIISE